jgi:hypothetical protein
MAFRVSIPVIAFPADRVSWSKLGRIGQAPSIDAPA